MRGVIRVPLAPIRSAANDRSEMVTQALFGELLTLEPVPTAPLWVKVTLAFDGYEGYMDFRMAETDLEAIAAFEGDCVTLPSPLTAFSWGEQSLHLPAGSKVPEAAWSSSEVSSPTSPMDAAMRFLGAPYLWGGKSVLGIDCSGLTQLAGILCGHQIPRDAGQQWSRLQSRQKEHDGLTTGDLVYFHKPSGDQVTHVGMAIVSADEPCRILHAAGEVRIDELTPLGIMRNGELTHAWHGAASWPINAESRPSELRGGL